jgi:hypothetical protein
LLFTQAGPNIDGIASQDLDLPIPAGRNYKTIVITAVVGDFPRNCEGRTVNVRDNTELLVPPEVTESGAPLKRNGTLSCLTFAAPEPTSAAAKP